MTFEDCQNDPSFFLYGQSFLKAAEHLHSEYESGKLGHLRFTAPLYYLYSHAMELLMKSFLKLHGVSQKKLHGHSLARLWEQCAEHKMTIDEESQQSIGQVVKLLEPYATGPGYELRYPDIGGIKTWPALEEVREAANRLIVIIRFVWEPLAVQAVEKSRPTPP